MLVIAHRYGNSIDALTSVEGIADLVEVDVHLRRGRIEVRHAKRLWLTRRHWERWYLLPPSERFPDLEEIVTAAAPETVFWIDCKGPDPRIADAVMRIVASDRPVTVSSKAWWVLHRFDQNPTVDVIRSAGNKFELFLLSRVPSRVRLDGVVVHQRLLDATTVARLNERHGAVFTWAVADRDRAEQLRTWGVRGVILDELELIEELASSG